MDPINCGLLNLFEIMINGVFCWEPDVNMITKRVSCQESSTSVDQWRYKVTLLLFVQFDWVSEKYIG